MGQRTARGSRQPLTLTSMRPANQPPEDAKPLTLLSIVIPARDEEGCIGATVENLHLEVTINHVPHAIVVLDDGSSDRTWEILQQMRGHISELAPIQNRGEHGFGLAIITGINAAKGDA